MKLERPKSKFAKPCMVCGQAVELAEYEEMRVSSGLNVEPKICDDCRRAILWAKHQMGVDE